MHKFSLFLSIVLMAYAQMYSYIFKVGSIINFDDIKSEYQTPESPMRVHS